MLDKIGKTIDLHEMISRGDNIIAALSGGADSVCLLLAMKEIAPLYGASLCAVHVNHSMRGEESDRDEEFCRSLCQRIKIPFTARRVDVFDYVRKTGKSSEEAARELRYGVLFEEAEKLSSPKIACAHNLCDSSETVLFNITRGTGIKGICGIPFRRDIIIRPLLDVTRSEIEEFLRERGQDFVTDSSNLTDDYTRNRIRHRVIPELVGINEGFYRAVSRLSRSAAEDEEYFSELLDRLSENEIPDMPAAVRKRFIAKKLSEAKIEAGFDRICELDGIMKERKAAKVNLSGDVFAVFENGIMTVRKIIQTEKFDFSEELVFEDGREIFIPQFDKTVKITRAKDDIFNDSSIIHKKLTNNCVNYVKIQGVAVLRNKRDGDRITPAGRDFNVRLKKLYNNMKVPVEKRGTALVIEDNGGIIWSEYGGASERVVPKKGSDLHNIFVISVEEH